MSSDADFTPLVMRILTDGLKVYGFGEQKTPEPFVNACSQFTYVEGLVQPSAEKPDEQVLKRQRPHQAARRRPTRADAAQRRGRGHRRRRLGAPRRQVGSQIGNQASFDPRNYGYRKLSDLVEATELFEVKRRARSC